jgi:hypothetical protein
MSESRAGSLASIFPPLSRPKNELTALVVGFLAGGLGLAIYLRSLRDGVATIAVAVLAIAVADLQGGTLLGAAVAGVWGAIRVYHSNQRLMTPPTGPGGFVPSPDSAH